MSRKQFVTQLKTFKISEHQQKVLDRLLANGSYATEAEIFRQGILFIDLFSNNEDFFKIINQYAETKN